MAKPLIDLDDNTLFSNSSPGQERRPGLSLVPPNKPKINLNDDNLFYKDNEQAGQDVLAERYQAMYGAAKPVEPPKKSVFQRIDDTITGAFGTNKPNQEEISQPGLEAVKAEQAQTQREVAARRAELGTDAKDRGYAMRTFDSAAAGLAGIVGSTAEYVGRQFGIKTLEEVGKKAQVDAAALTPPEQDLLQKVAGGIGSFLPMAAAGIGTGGAALALGAGARVATTLGSAAAAALEAPSIGQEAYEGAKKETGNEAVAERQGYKAIALNLPLSYITNKLGFFADKGGRLAQTGKTVLMEGTQEGGQKVLTNVFGYQPTGEGVSEEALVGGLTGGVVKQFTYRPEQQQETPKTPERPQIGDRPTATMDRPATDSAAPPGNQELPGLGFFEVRSTLATKPSVAAVLYLDANTDEQRELIRRAVDRAEIQTGFNEALGDKQLIEDTRQEMGEFPEFVKSLSDSLPGFVNNMPPKGVVKIPSRTPTLEEVDKTYDDAWQDTGYQEAMQAEADRIAAEKAEREAERGGAKDRPGRQDRLEKLSEAVASSFNDDSARRDALLRFLEAFVAEKRRSSPVAFFESSYFSGSSPDGDRGVARYIEKFKDELPGSVMDALAMENVLDPETGETLNAVSDSVRGGHIGQLRRLADEKADSASASDQASNSADQTPPPTSSPKASGLVLVQERFSREFSEKPDNFKLAKAPAYFNKLAQALGVEVVAYNYTGANGQVRTRAGMLLARENGKAVVAINLTKANQAALFVFGHEVYHELERRDPEGAASLAKEIRGYVSENTQQAYQEFYESKGQSQKTDSEIAADVMGQMFTDKKFWEQLGEKNPTLAQRVLDVIDSIIQRFKTNAESRRMQIGKELQQYEKVRDMIASFVAQAAEKPVQQNTDASMDDDIPAKKVTGIKKQAAPEATPAQDAKTLEQVTSLLREGKIGPAAKLFQQSKLYDKGFGSFTELQRMAKDTIPERKTVTVTTPDGRTIKADERKRYGEGVRMTKDGQMVAVTNPNAAQVAKTENADEDMDQVGVAFRRVKSAGGTQTEPERVGRTQLSLGLRQPDTDTPRQKKLRERMTGIVRDSSQIKFFRDTILLLQKQISDIDARLKEADVLRVQEDGEERVYRAINQEDERPGLWGIYDLNAYSRFEDGLIQDKPSSKAELLETRRRLNEELNKVRDNSTRARANLFRRSMSRLADQLMQAAESAIAGGMNPAEARAIFSEFYEPLTFREIPQQETTNQEEDMTGTAREGFVPVNPNQNDMFDGARVAMGIIADFRQRRMTQRELNDLIDRGLREGDFSYVDAANAFRAFGMSPHRGFLDYGGQVAARSSMAKFLSLNGNTTAAMREYVVSMHKVLQINPAMRSKFSKDEMALHDLFFRERDRLEAKSRRAVDQGMREGQNATEAFPNLLFNRFTLPEIQNLQSVRAPAEQGAVSIPGISGLPDRSIELRNAIAGVIGGTAQERETAWFEDVAYALRRRPDLKDSIFARLGDDKAAFDNWVQRKKDAIAKEAQIMAKAPAFVELRNLAEPGAQLDSRPRYDEIVTEIGLDGRQETFNVTSAAQPDMFRQPSSGRPNTSPSRYEQEYVRIANAELSEIPEIMDSMARLNAILVGKVDPDTGEILTDADADEMASAFISDLENRAIKSAQVEFIAADGSRRKGGVYDEGSNAPAALLRGDAGFGLSVEDKAEVDRRATNFSPADVRDESTDELAQEELVDITALGEEMTGKEQAVSEDEDVETTDSAPDQEVAAEDRGDRQKSARVPSSLTGEDYRFKRGPFVGVLIPAIVQERVAQITASWPSAPRIVTLPNADHLPEALRDAVKARLGKHMGAKGLYHDGQIYLFSDHITSLADVEFVLFHEAYGHLGLRAFLGAKFDQFLEQTYNTNKQVKEAVDNLMRNQAIGRLEAIDEVLSDMAAENKEVGAVKAFVGRVIAGLREIGFGRVAGWLSTLTNAELGYTLKMARKAAQEGVPAALNGAPDVIRLAEQRLPYEMFSGSAGNTRAYARYNPITGTWAIATAAGTDLRKGWNTQVEKDFEKVLEIMGRYGRVERRLRSGLYIDNKIASDLQKIPEFSIAFDDVLSQDSIKGKAKMFGRYLLRNSAIVFQNEYRAAFETMEYLRSKGRVLADFDFIPDLEGNHERRTAAELEDVREQYSKPIMKMVEQLGKEAGNVSLAQAGLNLPPEILDRSVGGGRKLGDIPLLDVYLVARHAEERNKHIAEINPKKPDGGSGMLTNDAHAILDELSRKPYMGTLQEISNYLRQISAYKLARLEGSGMITPEEAKARANYQDYVNLSGLNDGLDKFDDPSVYAGGSKFATKKDKRALGRDTMATDILARTLMSFEAAVISANKNLVKQKILGMLEFNYDPDFVSINKQAYRAVLDENGQVTEQIDPEYIKRKNVMVVHVRGRPTTVEFKRTGKGTFADAVHGSIFPPEVSAFPLRVLGKVNQVVGQMLTTWNPIWSVINFTRDAEGLYFNAVTDKRVTKQMARQMVKYLPGAVKASFHFSTDGKYGNSADPKMIEYFKEMRAEGGATSFLNLRGLEKTVDDLYKMLDQKDPNKFVAVGTKILDTVEAFNIPLEMAPRIAAYRVMRENGFSKQESAVFAGEITVNFNMRGSARWVRQMFLFFNPAVQGTAKMAKLAAQNPRGMAKIAFGMAAVGFLANMLARALGGEDDDGIANLDAIPVFKRATNILLPNPLGSPPFIAIPIPYGWNSFYAAGHFMADSLWAGSVSAGTTAKRILQSAFESFSPLGSAGLDSQTGLGSLAKAAAPTPILPIVELALNENRFGAPIVKTPGLYSSGKRPDSEMAFDSASPLSSFFAKGLNRLTGGDRVNPGWIDVNPGTLDYLISSYVPGIGAETYKFASWATKGALGYDTKDAKTPLDRLVGKRPDGYEFGMYRRAQELIKTKYDDYLINKENRDQILKEYPNLGVARGIINAAQAQIDNLREGRNLSKRSEMTFSQQVDYDNRSRAQERLIVQKAVKRILETNPQMRQELLASE